MNIICRPLICSLVLSLFAAAAVRATPSLASAAEPSAAEPANTMPVLRSDVESWLDGFMPYALQKGDIAGGIVVVVKDGEVLLAKGYGYSDVATRAPVDPKRTMFRPGSTSKLFTWTAVMQLVEQGKLDLDKDVNTYLPFKLPARDDGPITLRHIMTHTAGFEEQIKELIADDPKALVPLKTYAERSTPARIFKAGSTPAYSNYATALAGAIVEQVSGQLFDDYMDAHIFKPLGMTHSTFRQPLPSSLVADMSQGYTEASEPSKPFEIIVAAPAGSLSSSGVDMANFMIAHLQNGEFHGQRILKEDTARLMHGTTLTMIPPLNRMALGFYEQNYNGHRVVSHGGDTEYFHSYLHLFLDDNVGLFMSFNSSGRDGAVGGIRDMLFEQFTRRYFPHSPEGNGAHVESLVDAATARQHAQAIAGHYENSRRPETNFMSIVNLMGAAKVEANKDGTINFSILNALSGAPRHYREIKPYLWVDDASGWRLAATQDNGRILRFSVDQVSPFMVFEPSPWWRSAAWLQPAGAVSLGAVSLTALLWPVAIVVRRRHKVSLGLAGRAARAHRWSRIAAVALALMSLGWIGVILAGLSNLSFLSPKTDPLLFVMHLLSVVVFIGGALAMVWAAWVSWSERRRPMARLWATILALSALVLLWMAFLYHLMSFDSKY
jgi:CubicO group peptidase (beta-lactamase class C family)